MITSTLYLSKYKNLKNLAKTVFHLKEEKKVIVASGGVFDILHCGHIRILERAKGLGDILIVCVNTDHSTKLIKGPFRPINKESDRVEILCALSFVDYVTLFNEKTPNKIISVLKPDIWVKGSEYKTIWIPEASVIKDYGGKIVYFPMVGNYSVTSLIEKIRLNKTRKIQSRACRRKRIFR